ncbi:MAG: crossover junction endodeoxyribonuclease RuvC [Deltaproteobacteria bacterium]|nr:crossover junction endodeoxyribonuclease RuvC [Candidatus Anaeroferrophillus wilburensis]MBN2888742.1 crossover junction endodeoxyribonuclease RuvC [Deltaproteobacteria bacterium]
MLVLGIDPGSSSTGFGLVANAGIDLQLVHHSQLSLPSSLTLSQKLARLYAATLELINQHQPDLMAVEGIFFGRNIKSMIILGQARGAAMVAAANCSLEIFEYPPAVVKQTVVGYGKADKSQVLQMVSVILNNRSIRGEHAADALAVAICHHQHHRAACRAAAVKHL